MPTQFEKRKMKEATDNSEPIVEVKPKSEKQMSELAFDIRKLADGKYELVIFNYDPENRKSKIVDVRPIDKATGILFQQKKTALKTIARIK